MESFKEGMAEQEKDDVEPLPRGGFRCRLCRIAVANKPSLEDHLRGKKHQRLENLRTVRQDQELRSIFVSGFQKGTPPSELSNYFQTYGEVVNVVMDKEKGVYAIVELKNEEMLKKVLSKPQHNLGGQKLRVKPREKKDFKFNPPRKQGLARQEQLNPEKVAQKLCEADDVDAQMSMLVQLFEFSESERHLRDLLVTLFQEVFLEFFPGSAVIPFGSSVNGFDVSGCDLDLFLDLEKAKYFQASASGSSVPQVKDGASPKLAPHAQDSILSDVDLASATVPEVLELVAAVLQKCVPGVHNVQAVLTARRPVVKFCHKESCLRGDISINNRLAVCNTQFLQLYTEADERVRPLVYTVRYWAKQQTLAGNPFGGGPLLTNYALTLLVLYFLQTCSPPVLPTIVRLREQSGDTNQTIVDGWDCSFPKDLAQWGPSKNKESLCSLLAEFFHAFEDYDFAGSVISLREGQLLSLTSFLSSEASGKFKMGSFNLQDPFELSHNVTANVNKKTMLRFQLCCRSAAKYCRSLQYQRKSAKGKIWGLVRLFQPGNLEAEAHTDKGFVISLPLTMCQGKDSHQLWFQKVCTGVVFVFEDVLKCSCSEMEQGLGEKGASIAEPEAKSEPLSSGFKWPLDDGDDSLSPLAKRPRNDLWLPIEKVVTWNCAVWHHVWLGRRRVRRQLDPKEKTGLLELETKVSVLISQQKGEARPAEPLLRFAVRAQFNTEDASDKQNTYVSLSFAPDPEQAVAFKDFFHFLQNFLPQMLEQHLAAHTP